MGITLGGLMRGALPVLQQGLEAPMQDAVERMDNIGKIYNARATSIQEKQKAALSDADKIKTIAESFNVDAGVAEQAYKLSGKSIDKASKIVTNMLTAYDNNIPLSKVDVDKLAPVAMPEVTKTESVDIAPKNASNDSVFNSFKNLFKFYSPDQVVEMFAQRSNLPVDEVKKVLSNTFDMPELNVSARTTPEALAKGMSSSTKPSQSSVDVDNIKNFYMTTMNYNEEEATNAANLHVSGKIPLKSVLQTGEVVQNLVGKNGALTSRTVPRFDDQGTQLNPDKKSREDNAKRISSAEKSLSTISTVKGLLFKNPQVFTAFGRLQEATTNVLDLIGATGLAQAAGGADVKKAVQAARQFIKTAKEDIFDDPRISDRDLAIINQYIGIIMDDSFLGVGQTNALAAIVGLERASATQMAISVHTNNPALGNNFVQLTEDGFLDIAKDSVANRVFGRMMVAYGLDRNKVIQANKDKSSNDIAVRNRANYVLKQVDNLMVLAANSVQSLKARTSYATEEDFKKNYSNVYISTLGGKSNEDLKGSN